MTLLKIVHTLSCQKFTVHGFRSSFTDWAAECTDVPKEVVDKALAHQLPDRVEAAYRRTDFLERRRTLMSNWAEHLVQVLVLPVSGLPKAQDAEPRPLITDHRSPEIMPQHPVLSAVKFPSP
jgi:hypothetical protein